MNDPSFELAQTREELPRVLRRAMGFVRYARDAVGAQPASVRTPMCVPIRANDSRTGVFFFDFDGAACDEPAIAMLGDVGRRCARALARTAARGGSRPTWLH